MDPLLFVTKKKSGASVTSLDFKTSLPSGATFSRASIATYTNASGLIAQAASGVPRFDYNPSTLQPLGLLVEESRTNSLLYSQDFSNSLWQVLNGATKTAAYATAPDGTTTAARTTIAAGAYLSTYSMMLQVLSGSSLGSGQTHCFSLWVKSNTGSNQAFRIDICQSSIADYLSGDMIATTSWQRFSFSTTFGGGGIGIITGIFAGSAGAAADLLVWGAQLEMNCSYPTSYIPTTSLAVTRLADSLTMASPSWLKSDKGSLIVNAYIPRVNSSRRSCVAALSDGTSNNLIASEIGTTGAPLAETIISGTSTPSAGSLSAVTAGSVVKTGLSYQSASNNFAANGVSDGAGTFGASGVPSFNQINLGDFAGSGRSLNGHIQSLTYYPSAKTSTELVALTQ
jgi:hypothetical protein